MYTTSDGLASNDGAVTIGADGTVWVIHGDAISRREGETWVVHDFADSGGSGAVEGSDGTLWLATDSGIVRFDGDTTTKFVVPAELAPAHLSFSLEPAAPTAESFDAGSFGDVSWQRFGLPTAHHLTGGIDTAHGFAAMDGGEVRTTVDGLEWTASEPPLNAWQLVASGDDLYALGSGAVRLAWTGTTWKALNELSVPDATDSFERMAFGDGVTVLTARSRVFFSTDGYTFVPALQGPDSGLLAGAGEPDSDDGYAGGCDSSWFGGPEWDSIGPVFSTGNGFVAFTSGHPNDWNTNVGLCRPIVWLSDDGSTWDLVSSDSPFGPNALVYAIAEHKGRFVAVGGRGYEGLLWVSDDGLTWDEIAAEHINGSITSKPCAIAAGESGWVALLGGAGTQGEVRAMYSLDGLEWVVDTDPIPDLWWAFGTPDVAVGTDRILVTYDSAYLGEIAR